MATGCAGDIAEAETGLVRLCLDAAAESGESVERWRRQVRTLKRMPSHLAEALFHRLLRRRLLFPSLLEVFKHSVEEIDLRGENFVDAEWMAYLGAFSYLRSLNVSDCRRITSAALWSITGMANLKELNLSRCPKVSDAGIRHLISIPTLERLWISETGLSADGIKLLSSLTKLSVLDLGGLPVTDVAFWSLKVLTELQYLDLWRSEISNKGAAVLRMFPKLSFLNLAWTNVTKLPNLPSLACLNMSYCTIDAIFESNVGDNAPLAKLILSGAAFRDVPGALMNVDTRFLSFLDASNTSLQRFNFLPNMNALEILDLSHSAMGDDSIELVASIGASLRDLNLSNTRISSAGVGILAGCVPNLEVISLSQTSIDDSALSYFGQMPSLRVISLSNTKITGFIRLPSNELDSVLSLTALESLSGLERLDLEETQVRDSSLYPLQCFQELRQLSLKSVSLTDLSLQHLSSLPKLTNLSLRDAVLTNGGLDSFNPPETLESLDLRGCWLLTEDVVLLFCEKHPQIEVRHEHARIVQSLQNGSRCSFSQASSKGLQSRQMRRKAPASQGCTKNDAIIDQRLKYSREELLAMNYSSLSLTSDH
ncbi:uncharacterized protein LOC131157301 isoform X2 [Malania oleifera]|nr:uncharacterized protein LOC131157301 isoform X2 [Malania oleifera]XP_057967332.1 uncharacterized protein LOC131157301 isoform X2 [Malania oleifera]XP_057967333.1 uncharacterized protein LOC131157301 isoform X2 [Malania oleifera]XP_057967334.1 uncharacterized protein LOC131157301 isoform X2 [Malania oleifera]